MHRKRLGKLADPVIQKRRADLERMSHAHAIHFAENIVGEVILQVESQMPVEFRSPGDSTDQSRYRMLFRVRQKTFFLILGERSRPEDVRLFRRHE